MHVTLRVCSERVHKPLIHFLGKRSWPTSELPFVLTSFRIPLQYFTCVEPEPPHAHPAGPPDYQAHFQDFMQKVQSYKFVSTSPSSSQKHASEQAVYQEFWQAPSRLWNPRIRELSDAEMEAVLVSRTVIVYRTE